MWRKSLINRRFATMMVTVWPLVFVGPACGAERVIEEWIARYDNFGASDYASAMVIDDHGNVYVTGVSPHLAGGYMTVKFDPNGNEEWVARCDGIEVGPDIAVDALGNVFTTGVNEAGDYSTVKFDPNGNQLWEANYDGPSKGWDCAGAIALDNSGGVYITGKSDGNGTGYDYATIKYNSDINEPVWVARYNGAGNGSDRGSLVAVNPSGNVYVTGSSKGIGTNYDLVTIKYDADGNELWVAKYNGPQNGPDGAADIALDNAGNVYVAGAINYSSFHRTGDYVTIKYSADSNEPVWVATYNGPGNAADGAHGIALDDSGNVYVTGDSDGGGTDYDYATVKYNPDGNEVWVARYNGPANAYDYGHYITLDDSGNIYVTGSSWASQYSDYATIKYDANGIELWTARYNGPGNGSDYPYGLAVDSSGQIFVAGWSYGSDTGPDYAAIKYIQCTQVGDIDCDKDVDFGDYAVLAQYWRQRRCGECGWANLDDDFDVDWDDLKMLADNWLQDNNP